MDEYAHNLIEQYRSAVEAGGVGSMEPLLPLFRIAGNPVSLKGREPMRALFKSSRPKRMTLQAGRQVSKSYYICETGILFSGFGGMTTAIVEPRFNQKKNINNQILAPLIRDCAAVDDLIRPTNIDTLDIKKFLSGGQLLLLNGFKSGDAARGVSGAHQVMLDECIQATENLLVYDFELKTYKTKKICEIRQGDVLTSFIEGAILYSVAVRDASPRGTRGCYKITTLSGRTIECTSNHTLPTSEGKLKVENIIEYVYRISNAGCGLGHDCQTAGSGRGGEIHHRAAECADGLDDGGRLYTHAKERKDDIQNAMESELETARVQFTQVPDIVRARYKGTCEETESRLRRLLVSIGPAQFKNIGLVVCNDTSRWLPSQDNNPDLSCRNNSSDSTGMVVHGRRLEIDRLQQGIHSCERLHDRGSTSDTVLVTGGMGPESNCEHSDSLELGKSGSVSVYSSEKLHKYDGADIYTHSAGDAIQDRPCDNDLSVVRGGGSEVDQLLLFSRVCEGVQSTETQRDVGKNSRQETRTESGVEASEPGESKGDGEEVSGELDRRTAEEASSAVCGVSSAEPGEGTGETSCAVCEAERQPCIQTAESRLGSCIQREACTGPGEAGSIQEAQSGVSGRVHETGRCEGTTRRDTESLSCDRECGPGEESQTTGKRSAGREAAAGCNDRGAEGSGSSTPQRTTPAEAGVSREERSGATCGDATEADRGFHENISQEDPGRQGQNKCATSGVESAEGCGSRTAGEVSRTLQEESLLTSTEATYFYDPIVNIEYVGEFPVYDIEVEGTHNYILANGICSYNCQDILNANVPVFEAITDAQVDTGFRLYSGTAKTLDGTLAIKFEQSSQGHWCVKCSCGKYNIFALEEQLLSTIRVDGCKCAFCGKPLYVETGAFVHKFPSRVYDHAGYHLPQTAFAFHHKPLAWKEIIYKQNNIPKTQFFNEVLGVSDSDSVRLITKNDLLKARNQLRSKEQAMGIINQFQLRALGVDWGGGGGRESATGLAVLGKNMNVDNFDTLFITRLPTGLTPEQEANIVARVAEEFEVQFIAHDYTGAGFMREAFFLQMHPEWTSRMFPVSYSYKPTSDLVTMSESGSRTSYVIDKTKSLLMTISSIRYGALSLPWFDPLDPKAAQLDFLAIIEHEQKTADGSTGTNEVLRASNVYLLDKVAGVRDDAAQATNIGYIAMCHALGHYPVFSYDPKFDISEQQYKELIGDV